jgi:hypothetical protein
MKITQGKGIGSKWQYKEARVELKKNAQESTSQQRP